MCYSLLSLPLTPCFKPSPLFPGYFNSSPPPPGLLALLLYLSSCDSIKGTLGHVIPLLKVFYGLPILIRVKSEALKVYKQGDTIIYYPKWNYLGAKEGAISNSVQTTAMNVNFQVSSHPAFVILPVPSCYLSILPLSFSPSPPIPLGRKEPPN